MSLGEFELIRRFFSTCGRRRDVLLGVGDDAALVRSPPGQELVVTVDTLVEGVHFLPGCDPRSLGHKTLAVSLSDLAAMGAEPAWATLALTLPASDAEWAAAFSRGLCELASGFGVQLIGGDTTRGPRAVSVQAIGLCSQGGAMRRSGARPGDRIYVTGSLGDAALGLLVARGLGVAPHLVAGLKERLDRPMPRVAEGLALRPLASAAIDVSDGLAADLGHILEASGVGASIRMDRLPLGEAVAERVQQTADWSLPLAGGDDYELCVTVAPVRAPHVERLGERLACGLTWIGTIEAAPGLRCLRPDGGLQQQPSRGWDHFAGSDG